MTQLTRCWLSDRESRLADRSFPRCPRSHSYPDFSNQSDEISVTQRLGQTPDVFGRSTGEIASGGIACNDEGGQIHPQSGAEMTNDFKPAGTVIQMKIHHHRIGSEIRGGHTGQRIGKVWSRDDEAADILQCPHESLADRLIIVDDQHMA